MADREMGLKTSFADRASQAVFHPAESWPLFGVCQVGPATIDEFKNQAEAYVRLVVSHKESGAIYTGGILKDDPPPSPDRGKIAGRGGRLISEKSYFNVDLKTQCRIPGQPGKYWAVVLLGKFASPVLEFEVR